jgi:uncharacterized membrane protein
MKLIRFAIILVLILTAVLTLVVYPMMPDAVASHWNAAGDLNGTMPKFWGLILIPLIMYGFWVVIYFVVDNKYLGRHNEKYVSSKSVQ